LDRLFNRGTVAGFSEGKLLEQFVSERDEAAFAALVARHGPMVLGVCRRMLRNEHDVEDAFQATFLVLVRRAPGIRDGELVGHWLHGVAHRVAVRARAQAARRHVREQNLLTAVESGSEPAVGEDSEHELRAVLDEELDRLPASLRLPMVLCYLEGMTHDQAAQQLKWPVGTVRSRMARARDLLRQRLSRRGIVPEGAGLAASMAAEPLPPVLLDATVQAAFRFATRSSMAANLASASAAALARGVLKAMIVSKLKIVSATALVCILALGGVRGLARQPGGDTPAQQPANAATGPSDRRATLLRSVDRIDASLDDQVRRSHELQQEVRELRKEIKALRLAELPTIRADVQGPQLSELITTTTTSTSTAAPLLKQGRRPLKAGQDDSPNPGTGLAAGGGGAGGSMNLTMNDQGPLHSEQDGLILFISPNGEKAAVYDTTTRQSKSVTLPVPPAGRHDVIANWNAGIIGLSIMGPNVTRIAVFSYINLNVADGTWHPLDLREPVDSATPLMPGNGLVAYVLGRYVYAFSGAARRWDILELPEGSKPALHLGSGSLSVGHRQHLYVFDMQSGRWSDIDTRAVFEAPESNDREQAKK
jgi:RNA polymerase sigma factor (sigma-70 family)